jgi:uncharacterized Rmd1/YagE family protein
MPTVDRVTMRNIVAFQIAESIDIKRFRAAYDRKEHYQDSTEVYYVESAKYLYVLAYGVVAFEGYDDDGMNEAIAFIMPFCRTFLDAKLREEFVIHESPGGDRFGYNDADLTRVNPDVLRIVMLNVAQSVAMDYFTQQADLLLEETNKHTLRLERDGKTDISGKRLIRFIGRTLNMKNRIAQSLYILDSPEETWEDEYLSTIDSALKRTFEINARHRNIDLELQLVKDNLEVVKDLVYHRESRVLEWIIIALILVEVLNLFFEKLLKAW